MKNLCLFSLMLCGLFASSCKSDDPPLPDNAVNFAATEMGFEENESSKSITLNINRAEDADVSVTLGVVSTGVEYGDGFATTPAVADGAIVVTFKAGSTSTTVDVKKVALFFDGDEHIDFEIKSVGGSLVIGEKKTLKLTFGAIVSEGAKLTLDGGEGAGNAANSVFLDLSANEQTSVARKSWNLGFYCGSQFAVILNNTTSSTAVEANINVDAVVNSADSAAFATSLAIPYDAAGFSLVDDLTGDLTKTIIKENKVYVVNLGDSQKPLYKIKVAKKDNDTYTLQYAKINESAVKSIDVAKDGKYNFAYVSFAENKTVSVEPLKAKWDIVWTKAMYKTSFNGVYIPYSFSDLVFVNAKTGVQAAEVLTSVKTFAAFTEADAASITFSTEVDAIGNKWRNIMASSTDPRVGIFHDRFYVIKDADGHLYKFQFLKAGINNDGGTRGYPEIEYALVK